jgi:cation:H+ antiporter
LVLGVVAMVQPLQIDRMLMRREVPSCLALQLLVPIVSYNGVISRGEGFVLLAAGAGYNIWVLFEALRGRAPAQEELGEPDRTWIRQLAMLVGGLVILLAGAQIFVPAAAEIARMMHISDRFIGLTVVALGTSMPELATGIQAARRGEVDLAVGNSLGSNILNISMVLGLTAMLAPIQIVDVAAWNDIGAAMLATTLLVPLVLKGSLNRVEGGVLTGAYVVYVATSYVLT